MALLWRGISCYHRYHSQKRAKSVVFDTVKFRHKRYHFWYANCARMLFITEREWHWKDWYNDGELPWYIQNSNRSIQLTYRRADARRLSLYFIAQRTRETLPLIREIEIELYGALSLSRKCHNVDTALYLGLLGCQPENVDLRSHMAVIKRAENENKIELPLSDAGGIW